MLTICDTPILLYWADAPHRLSGPASTDLDSGIQSATRACSDISLWEIAMLYARDRINNHEGVTAAAYINDILTGMAMTVLPITAEIAELAQSAFFVHGDPADRLIAATALAHYAPLISADAKLRSAAGLRCIW